MSKLQMLFESWKAKVYESLQFFSPALSPLSLFLFRLINRWIVDVYAHAHAHSLGVCIAVGLLLFFLRHRFCFCV